jgi:hypothetical protein
VAQPPARGAFSSPLPLDLRDDPQTVVARQKLQAASVKYDELLSRIEAAKIELDVVRAAFKYQYTVVRPPEVARGPTKPNVVLLFVLAVALAGLMVMLGPAALDVARGRVMEPWQIERSLKLRVLGEMALPQSTHEGL